jgi:hypothetical protein
MEHPVDHRELNFSVFRIDFDVDVDSDVDSDS